MVFPSLSLVIGPLFLGSFWSELFHLLGTMLHKHILPSANRLKEVENRCLEVFFIAFPSSNQPNGTCGSPGSNSSITPLPIRLQVQLSLKLSIAFLHPSKPSTFLVGLQWTRLLLS